jgi:hypothetical protein
VEWVVAVTVRAAPGQLTGWLDNAIKRMEG